MFPSTISSFSPPYPTMKSTFLWCERQISKLSEAFPPRIQEVAVRIGIILLVVVPLLGFWAQRIYSQSTAMPIPLEIPPEKPIEDGYGDYIVRYKDDKTAKVEPTTFNRVSEIIDQFHVTCWMVTHPNATPLDRRAALLKAIQEIDARLELVFIPKTLFELFFLKKSIEEDLEKVSKFQFIDPEHPNRQEIDEVSKQCRGSKNSWIQLNPGINLQGDYTSRRLTISEDNNTDPTITNRMKEIRSRLNKEFQDLLQTLDRPLKMKEIEELLQQLISFIQNINFERFFDCGDPSPASQFSLDYPRDRITGMKLSNESVTQVIKHAIRLECAEEAQGKIILYRGSKVEKDTPVTDKTINYSISYGGSLFAGIVNDAEATAFSYMHRKDLDAYAFYIDPKNEDDREVFFAPKTTLASLFEKGEFFHGRTKAFLSSSKDDVRGYKGALTISYEKFPYKSHLERDRLVALFKDKIGHSYLLKRALSTR